MGINDHVVVDKRIHQTAAAESYIHTWQHTAIIWLLENTSNTTSNQRVNAFNDYWSKMSGFLRFPCFFFNSTSDKDTIINESSH